MQEKQRMFGWKRLALGEVYAASVSLEAVVVANSHVFQCTTSM
jgi:hypothetical protein